MATTANGARQLPGFTTCGGACMQVPSAELEERLREADALAAVGRVATTIAHDFNNVLCAILGCGELLLDHAPVHSTQSQRLQLLISAALRGQNLVEQLLAYARGQRGSRHAPIDLCASAEEALGLVGVSVPASIELKRTIPQSPLWVMGDDTGVHQVIMNLCVNAIHAMESAGSLRVAIEPVEVHCDRVLSHGTLSRGRYVVLCVADEGCGMDEITLARIFDPFFTTKEPGRGTGLGLATVKAIIAQMRGLIDVKSVRGVGTAFCIYLPALQQPAAGADRAARSCAVRPN